MTAENDKDKKKILIKPTGERLDLATAPIEEVEKYIRKILPEELAEKVIDSIKESRETHSQE